MTKMKSRFNKIGIVTIIFMICYSVAIGQGNLIKEGDEYFKREKYAIALNFYDRVKDADSDKDLLFRRAICNFKTNNINTSKGQLTLAFKKGYENDDIYYYMAKTHHATGDYEIASKFYKTYLNRIKKDKNQREQIIRSIKQCAYGVNHKYNNEIAYVENLGEVVNTVYDDINPMQSKNNPNKYYYSSNKAGSTGGLRNEKGRRDEFYGDYFYDMYTTELVNGQWQYPTSIDDLINTSRHEIMLDLNKNGKEIYFLRGANTMSSTIVKDSFRLDNEVDINTIAVKSPVLGELGDVYLRVFNDSTYLFSSNRKGGYGGYDLYIAIKRQEVWLDPINLGPEINSPFNEITPFISGDGKTISFSSDRNESFGGYDIFSSTFMVEGAFWSKATNLGLPINSPGDDLYYTLSADGNTAMFSSDRIEGYGENDLYVAYLKEQDKSQLIFSRSIPFIDILEYQSYEDTTKVVGELLTTEDIKIDNSELAVEVEIERPPRSISIGPLLFGDDDNLFVPKNNIIMNDLIDLMTIYPEISIQLTSHSIKEGLKEFDLYFSIKRAEKLQDHFASKGIDRDRVLLRGCGSNYPFVKEINGDQITNIAKQINRRIDIDILDIGDLPIYVSKETPTVVDYLKDNKFQVFTTLMEGISFRVKVAKVKQMYKNDVVRDYEDVIIDKEGDSYIYSVGLYSDFFSALEAKKQLANNEFTPVIRVYYNGEWMIEKQIQEMAQDNIELQRFIDYRN